MQRRQRAQRRRCVATGAGPWLRWRSRSSGFAVSSDAHVHQTAVGHLRRVQRARRYLPTRRQRHVPGAHVWGFDADRLRQRPNIRSRTESVETASYANDTLTLFGAHGSELARFRRGVCDASHRPCVLPICVSRRRPAQPCRWTGPRASGAAGGHGHRDIDKLQPMLGPGRRRRCGANLTTAGVYRVTGRSPQHGDGKYVCTSAQPLNVTDPASVTNPTSIQVNCSIK